MAFDMSTAVPVDEVITPNTTKFDVNSAQALPVQTEVLFDEERNTSLSIPSGLSEDETRFITATQVDKKPKSNFFGMMEYTADAASQLPKGLANFLATTLPETFGGLIKEFGETSEARNQEALGRLPEDESSWNFFQHIASTSGKESSSTNKKVVELGQRFLDLSKRLEKSTDIERPNEEGAPQFLYDVGNVGGSVATSVGLLFATKNPAAVAGAFTSIFKSEKYREMREKGFTPETASGVSTVSSVPQMVLEFTGAHVMLHAFRASKPISRLAIRLAEEPLQEIGQQGSEEATDKFFRIKDDTREEITKRIAYAGLLGFIGGGPVASAVTYIETQATNVVNTLDRAALNQILTISNGMGVHDLLVKNGLSMQDADVVIENVSQQLVDGGLINEGVDLLEQEFSPMVNDKVEIRPGESFGDLSGTKYTPTEAPVAQTFSQKLDELIDSGAEQIQGYEASLSTVFKGRMKALDEEAKSISDQMTSLEKEKVTLEKQGKSTKGIQSKLDKLQTQFDSVDVQRGDLLTTAQDAFDLAKEKVSVLGGDITKASVESRLSGFKAGAKEGRRLTLQEVRKVQRDLLNYLKQETRLSPQERGQFISDILANPTEEALARNLQTIEEKVKKIEEKADVKGLRKRIFDLVAQINPVSGSVPKGKFTPEIQRILNRIKDLVGLTREQGMELIVNTQNQAEELATPEQALDNKLISLYAGLKLKNSLELKESLDELEAIISTGRAISLLKYLNRIEQKKIIIQNALADITGGQEIVKTIPKTKFEENQRVFFNFVKGFGKSMSHNWKQLMDVVSQDSKSKAGESFLVEVTNIRKETANWYAQREQHLKSFLAEYVMPAIDIRSVKEFTEYLRTLQEVVSFGKVTNARGQTVDMTYTRDQVIGFWMHFKDPTLPASFMDIEQGNAFTPAMIQTLNDYMAANEKDMAFGSAMLNFYRDFYAYINADFSDRNGIDLPFNPMYSPVRREYTTETEHSNPFAEEISPDGSLLPPSLRNRIDNRRAIKMTGAYASLAQHITDMTFYVEVSEKVQMIDSIFKDQKVKDAIIEKFGDSAYQVIRDRIKYFKRKGVLAREVVVPWMDALRRARTLGTLYKPNQYPKQLTGLFSYLVHVNAAELTSSIVDLMKDGKKKTTFLYENSPILQSRLGNLTVDISDALQSKAAATFLDKPTWANFMLFFSRYGALHADILGGYAVFQKEMKRNGGDVKAAITKMEDVLLDIQPSSLMSEQTDWQQKGSMYRMMTLFLSSTNKYFQMEQFAMRNAIKGRMTATDAAKIIFLFHIVLPSLFQFIADYGRWRWPEQMRAMILGSWNSIFLAGDYLENFTRLALKHIFQQDINVFDRNKKDLFIMGLDEVTKAFKALDHNTIMASDVFEAMGHMLSGATQAVGLPTKYVTENIPNTVEKLSEGDIVKALMAVSGATTFQLEQE